MNFHREKSAEPEINLIPFIDILLVVVIFLMLSTTYSKLTEIQLNLPVADVTPQQAHPREVIISIHKDGRFLVNGTPVAHRDVMELRQVLAKTTQGIENPIIVIKADAQATHQSVMAAMEAVHRNGLSQLTFAAQSSSGKAN